MALPLIRTREDLLSMLAEAAELEHNIMCIYLYAAFSLKTSVSEDLTPEEVSAVERWRKQIMSVCVQEMTHLAIVSNLTTALGGAAHFFHTAFPIRSGYFPSDFVMNLEPFSLKSLEHFIFLERSSDEASELEDAEAHKEYVRGAPKGRLMTHGGDYTTVGELYAAIGKGIEFLSTTLTREELFCGRESLQLKESEIHVEELKIIRDLPSALAGLDIIVEQGEGSTAETGSHFEMFKDIRAEYKALVKDNPRFAPARNCASNPIMRKPAEGVDLVWINHPHSAKFLDLANAIYDLMLRVLVQIYSCESRPEAQRGKLIESVFEFMKGLSLAGSFLSSLPASEDRPEVKAGISFAINRHKGALEQSSEFLLLRERLNEIKKQIKMLSESKGASHPGQTAVIERINACLEKALSAWS